MKAPARYALLGILLIAVLALTPFRPLKISGHSMEPTLHDGETYVLDQFYWKAGGLRREDIIVVRHGAENWVKRLKGLPGDTLQITRRPDDWITDVSNLTADPSRKQEGPLVKVQQLGPDELFVIGDNLNWSADSTVQEVGTFHPEDVIGIARTFTLRREFPFHQHL
jgi:signal peptidase I